jgi:hypothetical protein
MNYKYFGKYIKKKKKKFFSLQNHSISKDLRDNLNKNYFMSHYKFSNSNHMKNNFYLENL